MAKAYGQMLSDSEAQDMKRELGAQISGGENQYYL